MTQRQDEDDSFAREVDDAVRQDQAMALWRQYGIYAVAVFVVVLIGVGGTNFWRARQLDRAKDMGSMYVGAQVLARDGKFDEANQILTRIVADGSESYRILASMERAANLAKSGDIDAAVAAYDKLIADSSVAAEFRDAAGIAALRLLLDKAPIEELDRRMAPLTADTGVYRYSARELAGLVVLRAGQVDSAKAVFKSLADDVGAPQGVRARASEMLAALGG